MYKYVLSISTALALNISSLSAKESSEGIGAVDFTTCFTTSKYGKKEQENLEALRQQLTSLVESTEKELREIGAKFEDTEYLDSLSPKAEEELKGKYQSLQENLGRYQSQYYQVLQHTQQQTFQKIYHTISQAAQKVAQNHDLKYIFNKDQLFYISPEFDMTAAVIQEMDQSYDQELKTKQVSSQEEVNLKQDQSSP